MIPALVAQPFVLAPGRKTRLFSPRGTPAHLSFGLSMFVLAITAGIFLAAGSLLALRPHPLSRASNGFGS